MAGLAASPGFGIASTVLSTAAPLLSGISAKKSAYSEAEQAVTMASRAKAESQQAAQQDLLKGRYAESRARAVAAASGAGASDPTVINDIANLKANSLYNALSDLYSGNTQAESLYRYAQAKRNEGDASLFSGVIGGATTLMSGLQGFHSKYGNRRLSQVKVRARTLPGGTTLPSGGTMLPMPSY